MFTMFCRLLIFFSKLGFSKKHHLGISPEFQTCLIQIMSDVLSGLNWVKKSLLKGYQQMALVG